MINVVEVTGKSGLKTFVKFPFSLYKNNPYWVPPIINDEVESFNAEKNPVFKTAEAKFFLAYKDGAIVGRVAAIVNWTEIKTQKISKMRFGWFDFIDDQAVSKALLDKVSEIGKSHGLEYMEGPVGFSNLDKVGVLTDGFDEIGSMITWYNYAYYKDHYEAHGFTPEKNYLEWRFPAANADPKFFMKASALIKRRYKLTPLNFTSTKKLMPRVDEMFDLFNTTYAKLSTFVPMSEEQKAFFKKKYISFINPEFIKFIVDEDNRMVAFGIVMPSFSEALIKAKGKLFPFGFMHLLHAKKNSDTAIFYLIGILPEYQNKGLTAVIFEAYHETFKEKGIKHCVRTPELADNLAIQQIWKHFDPVNHKKRSTYKKSL